MGDIAASMSAGLKINHIKLKKTQSSSLLQKSKGQRVSGVQPYKVIFIRKPTKRTLFTSFFPLILFFLHVHMLCMSCVYLIDNDWLNHGTLVKAVYMSCRDLEMHYNNTD